jgi:hypothetical protein
MSPLHHLTFFCAFIGQSVFLAALVAQDPRTRCAPVHAWLKLISDRWDMCLTALRGRELDKMLAHTERYLLRQLPRVAVGSAHNASCAAAFTNRITHEDGGVNCFCLISPDVAYGGWYLAKTVNSSDECFILFKPQLHWVRFFTFVTL